ncbi:uncharacterized protein [Triticum aestivum]|uniref:uncharacterized protein n=1 Tax=Triticum aestivum TaxID=4565 RepID=UPI001D008B04|nr:uncharacterized protein LOC123090163 [Triticum aestivum]
MASERFRRNNIASLITDDGICVEDHAGKEAVIFQTFKKCLVSSAKHEMKFDLARIIKRVEDLDQLTVPFTHQEIDDVIKYMPAERAPGPDGFTGHFLKTYWHVIKVDFYKLCNQFHEGNLNLESINEGFITLIPKINAPTSVNDFRPITLLNCCLKIITKLLANRLQRLILKIVHRNQYGFLKGRSIQDCLAWAFEYIYQCQSSKKPIGLLNLDFAKAFDTIEHDAMLDIMQHMGFNAKWLDWIKDILSSGKSSINFHKSTLIPINCDDTQSENIAQIFGCIIGKMPFTYLGLPLGSTRPSVHDLMPMVCKVERRLTSTLNMISYGAKLSLVNSVITSLVIFALCTLKLPASILELLDKIRRKCWNTYYTKKIPHASDACGSFWWKDITKLMPIYRGITKTTIQDGNNTLLWKDLWTDDILADRFPRAFSFTRNEDISVQEFLTAETLGTTFHLPLSEQAHEELLTMQQMLTPTTLNQGDDKWGCTWGKGEYTAKQYYSYYFRNLDAHQSYKWIWKSKVTMKIKVFGWLLLFDRLNKRNMLKRRHYNIGDNYTCLLCASPPEETLEHLFFTCPFSQDCWTHLNISWLTQGSRLHCIEEAKTMWNKPMFMDIFLQDAWSIWKERNNKHFRGIIPSKQSWMIRLKEDLSLLCYRVGEKYKPFLTSVIQTLYLLL